MTGDPERNKLDDLTARIRQAEGKPAAAPESAQTMRAGRVGADFVATVAICAAIGWLTDRWLGTGPWGLLAMLLAGFVAGIANVYRALGGYDQGIGLHKRNGK